MRLPFFPAVCIFLLAGTGLTAQQPAPAAHHGRRSAQPQHQLHRRPGHGARDAGGSHPGPVSPEAQRFLSRAEPDQGPPEPLAARRSRTDAWAVTRRRGVEQALPEPVVETSIAGVPVRIVTPDGMPEANRDKVLLNLHGGGFNSDSGSYTETIPIAGYAKIKVVAVLYRLAPEHPYPAAVEDSVAVYKELLKSYKPEHIVIYGTSAGAVLTAEVAARLKQLGLPQPAALGIFSGFGDFARKGDSRALYALRGLSGQLDPPTPPAQRSAVCGRNRPQDPFLAHLLGSAGPAADALCHQHPRHAAERHGEPRTRLPERRRRCAAGGLRGPPPRLLVSLGAARVDRSQQADGRLLRQGAGEIAEAGLPGFSSEDRRGARACASRA